MVVLATSTQPAGVGLGLGAGVGFNAGGDGGEDGGDGGDFVPLPLEAPQLLHNVGQALSTP